MTSRDAGLKETENSGLQKHPTKDRSSEPLNSALAASLSNSPLMNQKTYKEGLHREGYGFCWDHLEVNDDHKIRETRFLINLFDSLIIWNDVEINNVLQTFPYMIRSLLSLRWFS